MALFYLLILHLLLAQSDSRTLSSRFHAIRNSLPSSNSLRFSVHRSNATLAFSRRNLSPFSNSIRSSTGEFFDTRGVSGDPCVTSSDCLNGVPCADFRANDVNDLPFLCNPCSTDCRCLEPFEEAPCTTDSDCPDFEFCAITKSPVKLFCLGAFAIANAPPIVTVSDTAGFAFESCTRDGHCRDDLVCVEKTPDNCPNDCLCQPAEGATTCLSDTNCETPGEICLLEFDDATIFPSHCYSERLLTFTKFEIYNNPSGEACLRPDECAQGLECSDIPSDVCTANKCNICRRPIPTKCTANTQCQDPREVCAKWKDTGELDCVSKQAAIRGNLIDPPQCELVPFANQTNVVAPSPVPTPSTGQSGITPTVIPSTSPSPLALATGSASPTPSIGSGLIGQGEEGPVTTGAANGGVCADTELLDDLGEKHRVYGGRGVKAWVLCDEDGSCLSAGHMVEWRGRVMRMRSYCDEVGCVKEVRWVDSPKWRRRWRGRTRTDGLMMTALAARWETRAEELLLRTLSVLGV